MPEIWLKSWQSSADDGRGQEVKKKWFGNITLLALMVFLFFAACDNADNLDNNSREFTINRITPDGSSDGSTVISTTKLKLIFDRDIPGLSADDIKINVVSFATDPNKLVSNEDFPIIKGNLTKAGAHTYELAITPGNSGRIKMGLDPYRGYTGWNAVDVAVHAISHFKGTTELTITGYRNGGGHITIPAELGGIPVTAIGIAAGTGAGQTAFSGKQLTSVSIPGSVTLIGINAFNDNKLTDIIIPDSVTFIGIGAFANNQLASVTLSCSITAIESGTFFGNQLTGVTIPDGVISIGISAFANNQLTRISIPDGVVSIGQNAFQNNQLPDVSIPSTVSTIRDNAFANNRLTEIILPDSVISLSGFNDNQLTDVIIPESVTSIGVSAFANNKLTTIDIPDNATSIGAYAFQDNWLINVTIHEKIPTIGNGAFANNRLTDVTISPGVIRIGDSAFANNQLTSVSIPDSVSIIDSRAFSGNQLTSITIGADLTLPRGSFGNGFENAYNAASKTAGTYTRVDMSSYEWELVTSD
jgi:hypothetical protein